MKKILVVIAAALIAVSANAQWYVGGSLSLDVNKNTYFSIAPEGGYTFNDHWSAGLYLNFNPQSNPSNSYIAFNIQPYARYTFFRKGNLSLFADAALNLNFSTTKYTYTTFEDETEVTMTNTTHNNTVGVNLYGGVAYKLCEHISLVSTLVRLGWEDGNGLGFHLNTPAFGVYYNF